MQVLLAGETYDCLRLAGLPGLPLLALVKAVGDERWITVHPNGPDEKGVPVMIRETSDGSAHVIGGAGGKLNYMRLTHIKSPEEYAGHRQAKKEAEKARRAALRPEERKQEDALKRNKAAALEDARLQLHDEQKALIAHAAQVAGWDDYDLPEERLSGLSDRARNRIEKMHHDKMMTRVKQLKEEASKRILLDHDAQAAIGLGEVPLRGDGALVDLFNPEGKADLGLLDLIPDKDKRGLGYQRMIDRSSKEEIAGELETVDTENLSQDVATLQARKAELQEIADAAGKPFGTPALDLELQAKQYQLQAAQSHQAGKGDEAAEKLVKGRRELITSEKMAKLEEENPLQAAALAKMLAGSKAYQQEIAAARKQVGQDPAEGLDTKANAASADLDFLKAFKRVQMQTADFQRQARAMEAGPEPEHAPAKGFQLRAKEFTDPEVVRALQADLEEQLRQEKSRSFLQQVEEAEKPRDLLEMAQAEKPAALLRHLAVGHYNAVNNLSQIAAHAPLIDRDVADTLGIAGTAQLLSRAIHDQFSPEEVEAFKTGLEQFHAANHVKASEEAQREAQEHYDAAKEIEVEGAEHPRDLAAMSELNRQRLQHIDAAREALGTTLGELEGYAALEWAMKARPKGDLTVGLGAVGNDSLIRQAKALGIREDEYQVGDDGRGGKNLTISEGALPRLVKPFDPEEAAKVAKIASIKRGEQDEEGWLPAGIVSRPRTTFEDPAARDLSFEAPLQVHGGMDDAQLRGALEDHIGAKLADGQSARSIRDDMMSAEFGATYMKDDALRARAHGQLNEIFPESEVEKHGEHWKAMADKLAAKHLKETGDTSKVALHAQGIAPGEQTYEALHRALSTVPEGVVAFKSIGSMTPQDQAVLRDHFWKEVAKEAPPAEAAREAKVKAKAEAAKPKAPPQALQMDIFGNLAPMEGDVSGEPEAQGPQASRWDSYVKAHHGLPGAYAALQDLVRGKLVEEYAKEHGRVYGEPLKTGKERIQGWDRHVIGALPPAQLEGILGAENSKLRALHAKAASRRGGKFSKEETEGARKEFADALMRRLNDSQQYELFRKEAPPQSERTTIGERAEGTLRSIMPYVASNFKAGQKVKVFPDLSMSGRFAKQQRGIKAFAEAKRMGLFYGAGSGKSITSIGAFTHLHDQGKVKRAIFAVPSVVQGQFGSEMLRFTQPGKYRWSADPGASFEQRMAAYRDPERHMVVVTHQALRDDMTKMIAAHQGISEKEAAEKMTSGSRADRAAMTKAALAHHGIDFGMMVMDEGHDALNRAGKANSHLANTLDSLSDNTEYYMPMTGTPVKNDASEAFDWASKLRPDKYQSRDEFMQRYGINTTASQEGLKREMDGIFYADRVDPQVKAFHHVENLDLTPEQQQAHDDVMKAYSKARLASADGKTDVDSMKVLSPSRFAGSPTDTHEAVAKGLQSSLGFTRDSALRRAVDEHPKGAKLTWVRQKAKEAKASGHPGVIFARSLESVKQISEALKKDGHRVVSLTGGDSSAEKEKKRLAFSPERPEDAKADILVVSDAGATGMNLQRGQWLVNYDTPMTAKTHEQRIARIKRIGQTQQIDVHDLVGNAPVEKTARERLQRKYGLADVFQSPTEMLDDTGLAHEINQARTAKQAETSAPKASEYHSEPMPAEMERTLTPRVGQQKAASADSYAFTVVQNCTMRVENGRVVIYV